MRLFPLIAAAAILVLAGWFGMSRAAGELPVEEVINYQRPSTEKPLKYRERYVTCRTLRGLKVRPNHGTFKHARKCRRAPVDFHKALRGAAAWYGVSYDWLHACVHAEGGHGPRMIWNLGGSSAFGPAQFMPGTYTRMATASYWTLRKRGVKVSRSEFFDPAYPQGRPDTLVGQAWAMSWGFANGRAGEWSARAC